jgi:hypothetical protein
MQTFFVPTSAIHLAALLVVLNSLVLGALYFYDPNMDAQRCMLRENKYAYMVFSALVAVLTLTLFLNARFLVGKAWARAWKRANDYAG